MPKPLSSQERLSELLAYDPETGFLTWKPRKLEEFMNLRSCNQWNSRYGGKPALAFVNSEGYCVGHVDKESQKAHRIIWKMQTGIDPVQIDHINGLRADNRWVNLRNVDNTENQKNAVRRKDNTSGVTGVSWYTHERKIGKWLAKLGNKHIGMFDTFEEAVTARKAAEVAYGYHPNHGKRLKVAC